MATRDRYFTGSTVSRYLIPGEHSWESVITQSGKPLTDADINLLHDVETEIRTLIGSEATPSGWIKGQTRQEGIADFMFPDPSDPLFAINTFLMLKKEVLVAGNPVVVEYTGTTTAGLNVITLDHPPIHGGAPPDVKRTDFVFLEVWLALVSTSPRASGSVQVLPGLPAPGDTVLLNALPLTAVAVPPGVDQFLVGGDAVTTAANIATAINDPLNSFAVFVTADAGGTDTVTIKSVVSGAAGNLITLGVTGVGMAASGATLLGGVDMPNKPTQDTLYRHGNVQAPAGVNFADDIVDPVIDSETTKRVQVQYRIRATGQTEAVNFKTEADGFSNASVFAQGAQASPVATYPFVKADASTVLLNSSAVAYGQQDNGLWIAGDGTLVSSGALGTVDGFVYAIPLGFAFRRNDDYNAGAGAGFDPLNNTEGALPVTHAPWVNPQVGPVGANLSDRPDNLFCDAIASVDFLDLRKHISLTGFDYASELRRQVSLLLDGRTATWAVDAADKNTLGAGSGDVSTCFLVCNQIGRDAAHGGVAPGSGSTTRGDTIRNFDHVSRRFGVQPVVERVVLSLVPTDTVLGNPGKYVVQANGGYAGWAEGDEIHLDLANLNCSTIGDWALGGATWFGFMGNASVFDCAPPGTTITDVLTIRHDDGHYVTAVSQNVQMTTVTGLGTAHLVITLDANPDTVNGGNPGNLDHRMVGDAGLDDGSARRILVELEITYPLGSGLTDTPDAEVTPDATVWTDGPFLENNTAQRPVDWENNIGPRFREGYREVNLEYVCNDGSGPGSGTPITDNFVSADTFNLRFERRVYGSNSHALGVTDIPAAQVHDVSVLLTEFGSSSRLVVLDTSGAVPSKTPLSGTGQTECGVTYFAQDPLPNYGGAGFGYQVGVYFRTDAPQTAGVMAGVLTTLPDPITVEPLALAKDLWSSQVSVGSVDLPFPYLNPSDRVPVYDGGAAVFAAEWFFCGTTLICVDDFQATTGMLELHGFVPADEASCLTFSSKAKDPEFRAMYRVADPSSYRPTVLSQSFSGAVRHKVFLPMLVRAKEDTVLWRKNELLLLVISRFAKLDDENTVRFTDMNNRTCAAIYRTADLLIVVGGN